MAKDKSTLRNPSPEELEQLKGASEVRAYSRPEPAQEEDHPRPIDSRSSSAADFASEYLKQNAHLIKPKQAFFEPDPVPFKLPSGNKLCSGDKLTQNMEIFVRRFASPEEALFTGLKDRTKLNSALNKALDMVIKSKDISIYNLAIIDKLAMFVFVIAHTYGEEVDISDNISCETCVREGDNKTKVTVNLLDLDVKYVPEEYEYPFKIDIEGFPGSKITMEMEYPSVAKETGFMKSDEGGSGLQDAIKSICRDISGSKPNGNKIVKQEWDDVIRYMPHEDRKKILAKIKDFSDYGLQNSTDKYKCSHSACPWMEQKRKIKIGLDVLIEKMIRSAYKVGDNQGAEEEDATE